MLRTRSSIKRASTTEKDNTKKTRLSIDDDDDDNDVDEDEDDEEEKDFDDDTDKDSDFEPKKDEKSSSSDSDGSSDDETESKFFKPSRNSLLKPEKNLSKFVEKYKKINSSSPEASKKYAKKQDNKNATPGRIGTLESDSSSDEFERAPVSLQDLGDFKKINNNAVKDENLDSDDSSDDDGKVKEADYFDFTQIIQNQELIKTVSMMKDESDKKAEIERKEKIEIDKSREINKKYVRRKVNKICKKKAGEIEGNDKNSSDMNVMELLKLGEGTSKIKEEDFDEYEDITENDKKDKKTEDKPKNIQVTIELPGMERRKEKKKCDIEAAIKRRFNLIKKENQIYAHKVHILCWIAHGIYVNNILNSQELMALALSLIPSKHCYPPKRCDLNYLEKLVEWYVGKIKIIKDDEKEVNNKNNLLLLLEEQFTKQIAYSRKDLALLFVCMVRALGLTARLIINLRPVPLKPPVNELISVSNKLEKNKSNTKTDSKSDSKSKNKSSNDSKSSKNSESNSKKSSRANTSKYFNKKNSNKGNEEEQVNTNQSAVKESRSNKKKAVNDKSSEPSANNSERKQPQRGKKMSVIKNGETSKSMISKKLKLESVEFLDSGSDESDSDDNDKSDDFIPKTKSKQKRKSDDKVIDRRVLSTDDDEDNSQSNKVNAKKKKNTIDEWAEVFLEAEEKWICVDLIRGKIHCTQHLYSSASTPVTYVLGWENNNCIKDLTRRYVPHWMTVTQKQRAEPEWWEETIRPYAPPNNARNREEDEELDKQLEDQPLPSSISEYKNHPLYALKRHLLKFQAIYPPDAPTVGFIKNEPVYSRTCVVELHTRESWIKEAKLVRVGEEPYKIVKARPKYDKMTGAVIKDLPLNLYGFWQVDDYIPPPAVDGKVPRNEYGNVELYKECMLPAGTVHLQLPGLNRVAKKLNIDCAPAVVGWDFHGGSSHPIMDGFIVCEEFRDKLLDAWNQEIDESAKRAKEKVEQRVYGNWRRIIKGLLIREKLKLRYGFEEPKDDGKSKKKQSNKKCTKK